MEVQLHSFPISALNRGKWSDSCSSCFTLSTHGKRYAWVPQQVQMPWRRENLLRLLGIKTRFLASPVYCLVTTPTRLPWLPKVCKFFFSIVINVQEISQTWIMISFIVHKLTVTHYIRKTVPISWNVTNVYHFPVPNSHFCSTIQILINVQTVHTKLTSAADKHKHRCNFKWCTNVKTVTFKSDQLYKTRALCKLHLRFHPVTRRACISVADIVDLCIT